MGYRSDVRIVTTRDGFEKLKDFNNKYLKEKDWKYGSLIDSLDVFEKSKNACYMGWNNIKWYDGYKEYEDVNAIMEGLDYLKKQDYSYRFARIGEEYTDIDSEYYDSINKDGQDLEFPYIDRSFDDDYTLYYMDNGKVPNHSEIVNDLNL